MSDYPGMWCRRPLRRILDNRTYEGMNLLNRRDVLTAAGAALLPAFVRAGTPVQSHTPALTSLTSHAKPIGAAELQARLNKVRGLMSRQNIAALLIEPGTSLEYFTGVQWHRSERITLAVIPADGDVVIITPAFEEPSVRESLQIAGDVRAWDEHESPYERIAQALRDHGAATGTVAVESTLRYFIVAGLRAVAPGYEIVAADALVRACRLVKSPAELELMQLANAVTLAALKHVHQHVALGMSSKDIAEMINRATLQLGGTSLDFALVLLNEASAYPHGSSKPQSVRKGSTILMDCGCTVHGYQSDISRTWFFGEPSARQRKVWATVKRGQELALETARIGIPVGTIDDAVRHYYEGEGWGPGYKLPGLPHRTGHGIGMDGHEPAYLVHGDETPLAAGMCFSDEPGIYIPGEFGVRLEDCWHMTETGPKPFTPLARSIEDPI
jgi:Xaa-Pro dipeptidase